MLFAVATSTLIACLLFAFCTRPLHGYSTMHAGLYRRSSDPPTIYQELLDAGLLVANCSVSMCDGPLGDLYCHGPLLAATWQLGLQDTCPGSKLKQPPSVILDNFKRLPQPLNTSVLAAFCKEHFENNRYLEQVTPSDWRPDPPGIANINNTIYKKLAQELHIRWKSLSRRFISDVSSHPDLYPILPVPNPFIVPGGDFDIYFYWDSYWIIKGLLVSGMTDTVKGILENFAHLMQTHGSIPNSGKIQLSKRTQPPLFLQMLHDYFRATNDSSLLSRLLPIAETELAFWQRERNLSFTVGQRRYSLFQYRAPTNCPRPENYLVDYWQGMNSTTQHPEQVWSSIASACESGWDFSSRWFSFNGNHSYTKLSIITTSIAPVDLNVFMAWNYRSAAKLYKALKNEEKSKEYHKLFVDLTSQFSLFWNASEGMWFDYDIVAKQLRIAYFPSNLYPLLVLRPTGDKVKNVAEYIERTRINTFPGGVPSSLPVPSREQWDFPNVWAPNVHLTVLSLLASHDAHLTKVARDLAHNFISTVYYGLFEPPQGSKTGLWEKYDARKGDGSHGGGGEYAVQEGFGWTNGAVLHLIHLFDGQGLELTDSLDDSDIDELARPRNSFMGIFGDEPHNVIILTLLAFCIFLAFTFSVATLQARSRMLVLSGSLRRGIDRSSRQRLLTHCQDADE